MDEPPDFQGLRGRGIALAQRLSGEIWTDYNLHDPGVTLLEQFCYALTELAYRADFPTADLLTGSDGRLDFRRLRLDLPRTVLPTRPVTSRDLALALSKAGPGVDRVLVSSATGAEAGLYDVHVVPESEASAAAALEAVRQAFHRSRNLCEDLRSLAVAKPVRCRLEARIEVRRRHVPERIAALIYDRCRRLMRDRGAARPRPAATRRDVFDDPANLHGVLAAQEGGAASLDVFFAELSGLDEVEDVTSLAFRLPDAPDADPLATLGPGQYRELMIPERAEEVGLVLVSRDLQVPFDLAAMHAEMARLRADHVARLADALDREDWAEPAPGHRRTFPHVPLGHGLPAAYGAGRDALPRSAPPAAQAAAAQLRGYLALGDALLANAAADLEALPDLYAGDLDAQRASYRARRLDLGPMPELAAGAPGDVAAAVASLDPRHERRGRMLEYLLALHGEEFSANSLRQHDLYRGPAERRDEIARSRARLLAEVAQLNRDRAAAPDLGAGERAGFVGLGRKLTILLDFPDRGTAPLSAALARAGLSLAEDLGPAGAWQLPRATVPMAEDPFAMLVPRVEPGAVDRAALVAETPFLAARTIGGEVFRRGVLTDAWVVVPEQGGGWRLILDPGGDVVLDAGRFAGRAEAVARASQIRTFLVDLNVRSEGVHLVEDVLLRGAGGFAPLSFTVVLPGWTARTAAAGFRRLAEETATLLCPVHLAHRVVWLDHGAMADFEALELQWRVAFRDALSGGPRGDDLARAAGRLRAFLAGSA